MKNGPWDEGNICEVYLINDTYIEGTKNTYRPGVVAQIYNPQTWEVKAGRLGIQGQPQLHGDFEASLGFFFFFKEHLQLIRRKKGGRRGRRKEVDIELIKRWPISVPTRNAKENHIPSYRVP